MYTTNCQVCGTKSSRNSRRCRKHGRTSTYTAVRDVPVLPSFCRVQRFHLVVESHIIRTRLIYHAASKVEFQSFKRLYSQLTFSTFYKIVYSRVKRMPESEKKQMSAFLIKRKIKKKVLVYVPGTYISPLVVALEEGVNSNPSTRERLLLRTVNPRQDPNICVHS